MERRLMKDFQIGYIEGIVNDAISSEKEPKDVFAKIARAIGRRRSANANNKSTKKDWNSLAQRKASRRDPIGSNSEVERRRMSRQSLRRYIIDNENSAVANIDPYKLVQYNPKLKDMAPAARVAYVKFKTRKIKKEFKEHEDELPEEGEDEVFDDSAAKEVGKRATRTSTVRPRPTVTSASQFTAAIKVITTS